jgi:hypothetical protein
MKTRPICTATSTRLHRAHADVAKNRSSSPCHDNIQFSATIGAKMSAPYEQRQNAFADNVVRGESTEALLDRMRAAA